MNSGKVHSFPAFKIISQILQTLADARAGCPYHESAPS